MPLVDTNDYLSQALIETVFQDGARLSAQLKDVKTLTSKELVEEFMIKVERHRNLIQKLKAERTREASRLRNENASLSVLDSTLETDAREAKTVFWNLHNQEKELKYRPPSDQ
jgi:transcription initiation factor IIE alpha subunit